MDIGDPLTSKPAKWEHNDSKSDEALKHTKKAYARDGNLSYNAYLLNLVARLEGERR